MRGSPVYGQFFAVCLGIIPAHAGLTPTHQYLCRVPGDHPRACGAHPLSSALIEVSKGSSPRMRGSLPFSTISFITVGIIPAHAGLTFAALPRISALRDHPRACGAHCGYSIGAGCGAGSSPRMRGSLTGLTEKAGNAGIIPAHAGLTYH